MRSAWITDTGEYGPMCPSGALSRQVVEFDRQGLEEYMSVQVLFR
ncbi:MAG: hypothetical protein ACREV7_13685 [Steroidobacteraceae bacterium]